MIDFSRIRNNIYFNTIKKCSEVHSNNPLVDTWYVAEKKISDSADYNTCVDPNKGRVTHEQKFAEVFINKYGLYRVNGMFYTYYSNDPHVDNKGGTGEEQIKRYIISDLASMNVTTNVSSLSSSLYKLIECMTPDTDPDGNSVDYPTDKDSGNEYIPFANGNYYPEFRSFIENDPRPVLYRFGYNFPNYSIETPTFNKWLDTLFDEEDKTVVQQYCGYCLEPTTKGQKVLMMFGDAEMGKSRIVTFMKAIMGNCAEQFEINNFLNNRFEKTKALDRLLLFDDDITEQKMGENNDFKALITNQGTLWYERKGKDAFSGKFFARLLLIGNRDLALPKNADEGYIRRLLPIVCKKKPDDFVKDNNFDEKLLKEIDGIVNWLIDGLLKIRDNNFDFDKITSEKTNVYIENLRGDTDTIGTYFKNNFKATSNSNDFVSIKTVVDGYKKFVHENCDTYDYANVGNEVKKWFRENYNKYKFSPCTKHNERGYSGLIYTGE